MTSRSRRRRRRRRAASALSSAEAWNMSFTSRSSRPADERRIEPRRAAHATPLRGDPERLPERHGLALALQRMLAGVGVGDRGLRCPPRRLADEDGARLGGATGSARRCSRGRPRPCPGRSAPRLTAASPVSTPARAWRAGSSPGIAVDQLERGPDGPLRVVLVRDGRAPDGHHRVADELLDRAAVALDDRAARCRSSGSGARACPRRRGPPRRVVNPTRSANRTETSRRSAVGRRELAASAALGRRRAPMPHSPQNFIVGAFAVPHAGQATRERACRTRRRTSPGLVLRAAGGADELVTLAVWHVEGSAKPKARYARPVSEKGCRNPARSPTPRRSAAPTRRRRTFGAGGGSCPGSDAPDRGLRRAPGRRRGRRRCPLGADPRDRDHRRDGGDPPHARLGDPDRRGVARLDRARSHHLHRRAVLRSRGLLPAWPRHVARRHAVGLETPGRTARQVVGFAALPFALSFLVTVPASLVAFGYDWFPPAARTTAPAVSSSSPSGSRSRSGRSACSRSACGRPRAPMARGRRRVGARRVIMAAFVMLQSLDSLVQRLPGAG